MLQISFQFDRYLWRFQKHNVDVEEKDREQRIVAVRSDSDSHKVTRVSSFVEYLKSATTFQIVVTKKQT